MEDKMKKWKKKGDELFAEMAEDLYDDEIITTAETTLKNIFKQEGIPYQRSNIKAFIEGLIMMLLADRNGGKDVQASLPMVYKLIAKRMDKKVEAAAASSMDKSGLK